MQRKYLSWKQSVWLDVKMWNILLCALRLFCEYIHHFFFLFWLSESDSWTWLFYTDELCCWCGFCHNACTVFSPSCCNKYERLLYLFLSPVVEYKNRNAWCFWLIVVGWWNSSWFLNTYDYCLMNFSNLFLVLNTLLYGHAEGEQLCFIYLQTFTYYFPVHHLLYHSHWSVPLFYVCFFKYV